MNCYHCFVETGCASRSAFAICQHCGVGICNVHLVTVSSTPGMAGGRGQKIICSRCAQSARSPTHSYGSVEEQMPHNRYGTRTQPPWWRRFRRKHSETLPEPEQVIAAVERFLKQQ